MNVNEGAILREALVERVVDSLVPSGPIRFHIFGAVRMGALEAAHEIAKTYPQLAEQIYERFGMSGWGAKP